MRKGWVVIAAELLPFLFAIPAAQAQTSHICRIKSLLRKDVRAQLSHALEVSEMRIRHSRITLFAILVAALSLLGALQTASAATSPMHRPAIPGRLSVFHPDPTGLT